MKKLIAIALFSTVMISSSIQGFFFGCGWYRGCCPTSRPACGQNYSYRSGEYTDAYSYSNPVGAVYSEVDGVFY
ncbi:hypothetical protein [Candidatus Babela massiliensis]|uniref:Uncharacterized protein n=1 Tax=Candidatus Babela massiliensis TaxID=673862 RepID=V6DFJ4_9BACT|nr:hypothetical protein [Candidatus Babela massiliensis]CDK30345.1 hypothetical protein BABL1_gene_609 [Candidatus Babela massiliensis]